MSLVLPPAPPEDKSASRVTDTAPTSVVARSGARTRILQAEDNPVNQLVAKRMLALLDCDVEVAETGKAVLQLLDSGAYDLILMDCMMPEMDGYEATAEVRRRESHGRDIPIIGMTANAMEGDRERCLSAGMDDFLSKPVSRDALRVALERWRPGTAAES